MNEKGDNYFTIWYGVISVTEQELSYASAGHPPGILIASKDKNLLELTTENIPIGMLDDFAFEQNTCPINKGDILYILSDGVYEVTQTNDKLWGFDNLIKLIEKYQDRNTFTLDKIWQYIQKQHKNNILDDDFSLIRLLL
jgi:sigma-B regulation protein RsbU (phosphoserine phosphatase)